MNMVAITTEESVQILDIRKSIDIAASLDIAFEAVLEELGPGSEMPDGTSFPMKIEPWPGGRWFRDLGNNAGHLWGHVQVIKPPGLLELCGPMFMSYPAMNFVQYRLMPKGNGTLLNLTHRAMGLISPDVFEGAGLGWEHGLKRVSLIAERLAGQSRPSRPNSSSHH